MFDDVASPGRVTKIARAIYRSHIGRLVSAGRSSVCISFRHFFFFFFLDFHSTLQKLSARLVGRAWQN